MTCPECGSTNLVGPDRRGVVDCLECGAGWTPGTEES